MAGPSPHAPAPRVGGAGHGTLADDTDVSDARPGDAVVGDLDAGEHARLALVSTALAAVSLIGGWMFAPSLQAPGLDWSRQSMTALAADTTPHRWAMTLAFALSGAALLVSAWVLPGLRRPGRVALAVAGAATAGLAVAPNPSLTQGWWVHTALAVVALVAGGLWTWWTGHRLLSRVVPVGLVALVATLPLTMGTATFGVHERWVASVLVLVPLAYAAWQWWVTGHLIGDRRARAVLGVGMLTLACAFGGASATNIAPASAQTTYYSATFSLSPDLRDVSRLRARTIFGDIDVSFSGFAPGVHATPQVKASISEVLARPGVSIRSLEPDPTQLGDALRTAGLRLGWHFLVGACVVALSVVGVAVLVRRTGSRPRAGDRSHGRGTVRGLIAGGLAAVVLSTAGTAVAVVLTYRRDQVRDFTSTGVLGIVQRNSALLSDVEVRSSQVTPYLRNLMALSSALQDRYTPTLLEAPVALRLLLVSDLHDGNQYGLMRSIIAEEDVDAVIDAGDLVNFGTVQEGEVAGMFKGIASLGVPYIFVRGNHDAAYAGDEEILDRLARIPDVVLLQPSPDRYTELFLNGVRIRGFNDPRWFGDDGIRTTQKQRPAVAAFTRTFAERPEPDLLVSHEPSAVIGLDAGVLVNGHMHTADLEGNRIQVGTFTGGGPLTHFVPAEEGAELVGQPSAFDVLTISQTCRVNSLTRYRFRDVLEGRPAYDSVSLVNGARIDRRSPEPGRTCARTGTLVKVPVAAVDAESTGAAGPLSP